MTRDELLTKLKVIKETQADSDYEVDHVNADTLLIEYINNQEIADAFWDIEKWYA